MQVSIEVAGMLGIIVTLIFQGLYVAYKIGQLSEKLVELEKKQDKHNNLIERTVLLESSASSAHKRIDEIESNCHQVLRSRLRSE